MAKNKLNYPTVEQVKQTMLEKLDTVTKREYNGSTFYSLPWEGDKPAQVQVGDVVGTLTLQFSKIRANDAVAQAATAEGLAQRASKLSAEERRKLAESLLADLD